MQTSVINIIIKTFMFYPSKYFPVYYVFVYVEHLQIVLQNQCTITFHDIRVTRIEPQPIIKELLIVKHSENNLLNALSCDCNKPSVLIAF